MIINTSDIKSIYICTTKIDFRKQIDGLISVIISTFNHNVLDHSLYIFMNSSKNKIKAIYYDGTGFWMLVKRMEKSKFKYEFSEEKQLAIMTETQLSFLLEGLAINQKYIDKISTNSFLL